MVRIMKAEGPPRLFPHKESTKMPSAESTAQTALLVMHSGDVSHAIESGCGVVTIGREPEAGVQPAGGHWRIVDTSPSGMFVDGQRRSAVTVTGKTVVRFGDFTAGMR
jgi:hypothetical protein